MKNSEVFKLFGDFFFTRGFQKRKTMVYQLNDYISLCFFFECTNIGSVYFAYSFFPIIMPSDFFHYTYGGRLVDILPGKHTSLTTPYETEESIQEWVQNVKDAVDSKLIPFYQMIENPATLLNLLNSDKKDRIISCPFADRLMFSAYLKTYIGKSAKETLRYIDFAKDYLLFSPMVQLSEELRFNKVEELDVLASYAKCSDKDRVLFFNNIKNEMRDKFF